MQEQTLAIIKPNAMRKNVAGRIISMWEENGFAIKAIRRAHLTPDQAKGFYAEHEGKPFFDGLVEFMTSGPVLLLILEKEDAILANRTLMGATNPENAEEGTIRKLFADSLRENAVHGSDSPTSARRETAYFFSVFERVA